MQSIVVLGAGAWGTALSVHLAKAGHAVTLWAHSDSHVEQLQIQRENQRYLKGVPFPNNLTVSGDLAAVLAGATAVLIVVPSQAFAKTVQQVSTLAPNLTHLAWATKGFEPVSHKLLHQVAQSYLPVQQPFAVLSGPTFAEEVAQGLPTAMVAASETPAEAEFWAALFHFEAFRMYTQNDVAGVEVGGAYKNIMAIATGVCDGLNLGANARAALIARGTAEMMRFSAKYGAQSETLMGLAGLGDLVLTCTDDLSRNRRFGLQMARTGQTAEQVIAAIGQVVEGAKAVKAVMPLAKQFDLELPIAEQVYCLVQNECSAQQAVANLLGRTSKSE